MQKNYNFFIEKCGTGKKGWKGVCNDAENDRLWAIKICITDLLLQFYMLISLVDVDVKKLWEDDDWIQLHGKWD